MYNIEILNNSNLKLFIQNEYITAALNNPTIIQFTSNLPPVVTQPLDLIIDSLNTTLGLITHIATATSDLPDSFSKNFFYEVITTKLSSYFQLNCDVGGVITDGTQINNPFLLNRGQVIYELQINNEWKEIGRVRPGGTFTFKSCDIGIGSYVLRSKYVLRAIPNCGGTSPIIFETDYQIEQDLIEILNFKASIAYPTPNNCFQIKTPINVIPQQLELNNTNCNETNIAAGFDPNFFDSDFFAVIGQSSQQIDYLLERYAIDVNQWVEVEQTSRIVTSNDPLQASYTFTPQQLGPYRVKSSFSNCCDIIKSSIEYEICDSVIIRSSCQDVANCKTCGLYEIKNLSLSPTEIIIRRYNQQEITRFVVDSLSTTTYRFPNDDIYIVEYDNKFIILDNFCIIRQCYNKLLKEQLCKQQTKGCCDDKELFNSRLATIQPIYQLFLNKVERYSVRVNYRFTQLDITNELDSFMEIEKIRDSLLKYCDICKNNCPPCFNWSTGTCI
jgi:hypothetical protein